MIKQLIFFILSQASFISFGKTLTGKTLSFSGQNKNQYVMGYFMRRVLTCRHQEIEYLMQIPGHARCLVNGGFAHLKQRYRPTATHLISYSRSLTYPPALTKLCVIQHGRRGVTGNPSCPPNSDQCVACGKLLHSRFVRFMFKNVCGVVMYAILS